MPSSIPINIKKKLDNQPDEITIIKDFIVVGGSSVISETPNDIDLIIRSDYDGQDYKMPAKHLLACIRRFLDPEKRGDIHIVDSKLGSFTDFISLYDLVAKKRNNNLTKIESDLMEKVDKTSPTASDVHVQVSEWKKPKKKKKLKDSEILIKQEDNKEIKTPVGSFEYGRKADEDTIKDALKASEEDHITLGEFFFQKKPANYAVNSEPQSKKSFIDYIKKRKKELLPGFLYKKLSGLRAQVHKDGDNVTIYTRDGSEVTYRYPDAVKEIKQLKNKSLVLDVEIERWKDDKLMPIEDVAKYNAGKFKAEDRKNGIVFNVFDVLYTDDDIHLHRKELSERLAVLIGLGILQKTITIPNDENSLNLSMPLRVKDVNEIENNIDKYSKLPGSEGVIIKKESSKYDLDKSSREWVKFRNFTDLNAKVTKIKKTKSGTYVYTLAIRQSSSSKDELIEVVDSYTTSKKFDVGDLVLLNVSKVIKTDDKGDVSIGVLSPRIIDSSDKLDDINKLFSRAKKNNVAYEKVINKDGSIIYKTYDNLVKNKIVKNCDYMFIVDYPSKIDSIRGELLTGINGNIFNKIYMDNIGIDRDAVSIAAAIPHTLLNKSGKERPAKFSELNEWKDNVIKQIDKANPKVLISLGKSVQRVLDDMFDIILPAPDVLYIDRKCDIIKKSYDKLSDLALDRKNCYRKFGKIIKCDNINHGENENQIKDDNFNKDNEFNVKIYKTDDSKRIVYGVVLDPYQVDAHNDWIPVSEIEKTAHNWFKKSRMISLNHTGPSKSVAVESFIVDYPSHEDYKNAISGQDHKAYKRKFGNDIIKSGSWIIGTELSEEDYELFKSGKLNSYSIEGFGVKRKSDTGEMPKVTFIEA